jgi:Recombinase
MERVRGETSSSRRGGHGALANKRAADSRARALVPIIRKLTAAGFVSRRALADELNRRAIPTARGGRWHYTTVVRMLTRLGLKTHGQPHDEQWTATQVCGETHRCLGACCYRLGGR